MKEKEVEMEEEEAAEMKAEEKKKLAKEDGKGMFLGIVRVNYGPCIDGSV